MRMLILAVLLAMPSLARADLPAAPFALPAAPFALPAAPFALPAAPFAQPAAPFAQPAAPFAMCRTAISAAERLTGVPDRLMQAIGVVESGRRDANGTVSAWPWTINAEGVGSFFASKAEAIAAVTALRARGVRSIDVGCMQVNLMYHADAFASLEEAFDPGANARYAGRFLQSLWAKTGSWPGAAAGYHSLTPEIGADYGRKVVALWTKTPQPSDVDGTVRQAGLQTWAPSYTPPASTSFSAGGGARIIPLPASISPAQSLASGHGLDAYRAAPTRLASRMLPGRLNTNS